ncbi:uracil-DNA glycosylase [Pseudoxanthomonas kaohsiungensis]|uniref:Uracil-DNA glycosylase n=1 Tax=Pseudoxanthomonas kaohsiungensis TaxID=283923 RepID=A0ABW3M0L8_9GAMM|nr:uracil-DNA glycosylase [Pseudoxanthomonas kaohsiungensis]KAF1704742.1 uracil-DNA glycosylase [Pseudoxanthomonas kaohsiungensis]
MKFEHLVDALASVRLNNVFNPYADVCPIHDRPDAPAARRANLLGFLKAARRLGTDTIWMGRDLGYRGGRRTGLALTDERHLPVIASVYGSRAGQATVGPAMAERTAAEIWAILSQLSAPPFLWNVFPFHPHEPNDPFSNRKFTSRELTAVHEINNALIRKLGIRRIVAIGQDAAHYSAGFGVEVVAVRHPSYGGVNEFRAGIQSLYPASGRIPSQALAFELA